MKRILSIALIISMLLTTGILMTSCSKVNASSVEKDAQKVIGESVKNAGAEFFDFGSGFEEVATKALNGGSAAISFEGEFLGAIEKISETLYFNAKDEKAVSDTIIKVNGEDISLRAYLNKEGVILGGKDVFGSETNYALNLNTFFDKFPDSTLAAMFGFPSGDEEIKKQFADMKEQLTSSVESVSKDTANELLALLDQKVDTAKVTDAMGKSVKCVVVTYTVNNTTIKAFAEKVAQVGDIPKEELDTALEALNEISINGTISLAINQKNGNLTRCDISLSITEEEVTGAFEGALCFSSEKITLNGSLKEDGTSIGELSFVFDKKEEKDKVVYTGKLDVKEDGISINALNIILTSEKSGDFKIECDVFTEEGEDREGITVKGKLTESKNEAKLEITSIETQGITVSFNLAFEVKAKAEMPKTPDNAKDIVTLTEAELMELMEKLGSSKLAELLSNFMGDEVQPLDM